MFDTRPSPLLVRYRSTRRNQGLISDLMSQFVATTVLIAHTGAGGLPAACGVAELWVEIGLHCLMHRNFNTVFEVATGLQKSQLYRLPNLRARMESLPAWRAVRDLTETSNNYRFHKNKYRVASFLVCKVLNFFSFVS